jgi:RNA-directed DNA polymerase
MAETSGSTTVSTKLQRVAELARGAPEMVLTTLAHHIDLEWLREAYRRTRKDAAPGIDGQTAQEYAQDLEQNLRSLLERFKSGSYKAPPVRRSYLAKADGSRRRLGIPTFEDKVLQRAVVMLLEAVYEQAFLGSSYGFRPGRSAHQALDDLWQGLMRMRGGYVLEVDISSYFDEIDHGHLRAILDRRVRDGVIRRTIDKWLKAGVLEEGVYHRSEAGAPQGGVASPILANIYLHEVLDVWFEREIKPRLEAEAFQIRYADDVVLIFASERDARRVEAVLPKRFAKYGLRLHPTKTRLVQFRRPGHRALGEQPGTFDFLGFTHYWSTSRRGHWVIKRKTARERFTRGLDAIRRWCRENRHKPVAEQHRMLSSKLRGHFQYYGITGNAAALGRFRYQVRQIWRKWLSRRSQRGYVNWAQFHRLSERYPLPAAVAAHSILRRSASP